MAAVAETANDAIPIKPVDVPFGQDLVPTIPGDGPRGWNAILNTTCENMGLDYSAQLKRLKRNRWATMAMMAIVTRDGKTRDVTVMSRPVFLMWLATLDTERIKDDAVRAKVGDYQSRVMDVLDRFFDDELKERQPPSSPEGVASGDVYEIAIALNHQIGVALHGVVSLKSEVSEVKGGLAKVEEAVARLSDDLARSTQERFTLSDYCRAKTIRLSEARVRRFGFDIAKECKLRKIRIGKSYNRPSSQFNPNVYPVSVLDEWELRLRRAAEDDKLTLFMPAV